ncbi:uncharacterized protein MYCFIDRAFT_81395 [Pseudocercospora fijiensis CIRAD86]|uniref:F-box domain-containing protein n=1 Tax=Pseudocercospora fijiensis (strain CIRAD86) TaxID=383855 RepID=M3AV13_PSEFD|nr:uncharacterized protein MYCFIDRAFT_81395 [Pseudocercospora fijiensis CIRAD86]EME81327.1 hypothetical protein MYCFIDRAFT_81395 [Pseudocercospora fijiensis CIRAD86]
MANTSTGKALATPELLEAILINLPIRDLFLVQRVCRLWRDSVLVSKPIKRQLFLELSDPERHRLYYVPTNSDLSAIDGDRANFLDRELYHSSLRKNYIWKPDTNSLSNTTIYVNPILHVIKGLIKRDINTFFATDPNTQQTPVWNRPEASWRHMLVCSARLTTSFGFSWGGMRWFKRAMVDTAQWRLGDFVDELQRQWQVLPRRRGGRVPRINYTITGSQLWCRCE